MIHIFHFSLSVSGLPLTLKATCEGGNEKSDITRTRDFQRSKSVCCNAQKCIFRVLVIHQLWFLEAENTSHAKKIMLGTREQMIKTRRTIEREG